MMNIEEELMSNEYITKKEDYRGYTIYVTSLYRVLIRNHGDDDCSDVTAHLDKPPCLASN